MNRLENVNVYNVDMEDFAYLVFVLGRDFLHDKLKYDNGEAFEDDIAYETCANIIVDFMKSEEYQQHKSVYDCLIDYLNNREGVI